MGPGSKLYNCHRPGPIYNSFPYTIALRALFFITIMVLRQVHAEYVPPAPLSTYWDCCKPSAAWMGAAPVVAPVRSCAADGVTILHDTNAQSGCGGGPAYTCIAFQPFTKNGIGYAFSARPGEENAQGFLCACYHITTRGHPGKQLITQVTNEGHLSRGVFDLQVPGGGVGELNACPTEFHSPSNGWGQRYGGVQSRYECKSLPPALRPGCHWKFDFLSPGMVTETVKRIKCPTELTSISGCIRHDDL